MKKWAIKWIQRFRLADLQVFSEVIPYRFRNLCLELINLEQLFVIKFEGRIVLP